MKKIKIQKINLENLEDLLKKNLGDTCKVVSINRTLKSTYGELKLNKEKLFFKIKKREESLEEIGGYYKIFHQYPVPALRFFLENEQEGILIYDFETTLRKRFGLLLDYLNEENKKIPYLEGIFTVYQNAMKEDFQRKINFPLNKYFKERINTKLKEFLDDKRAASLLDYKIIINGEEYVKSTREIVKRAVFYLNAKNKEICFLSQGDPLAINIGTKPIFLDLETAGLNPLVGEFSIFLWGIFIAETYYHPKYHKEAYLGKESFIQKIKRNEPRVRFRINSKKKTLDIQLDYKLTKIKKNLIKRYLTLLEKNTSKEEFEEVLEKLEYFLPMRILATLNMRKFCKKDLINSVVLLHIFCNSKITKNLNMRDNLMCIIEEGIKNEKTKSKGNNSKSRKNNSHT